MFLAAYRCDITHLQQQKLILCRQEFTSIGGHSDQWAGEKYYVVITPQSKMAHQEVVVVAVRVNQWHSVIEGMKSSPSILWAVEPGYGELVPIVDNLEKGYR